jgi:hypothetical protein
LTPAGNQPTTVSELHAEDRVHIECRAWVVAASFDFGTDQCVAECCEYRQHVRASPIWIIKPGSEPFQVPTVARWDTWYEDHASAELLAPATRRYGYRGDRRTYRVDRPLPSDGYFTTSSTLGKRSHPREPAWLYLAKDAPHFTPHRKDVPTGSRVIIDIAFRGQIIDVCADQLIEEHIWRWQFSGVV